MHILGVDEAGRGPLAGPVFVAGTLAQQDFDFFDAFPGLNDSKKLTEKRREELFTLLEGHPFVRYTIAYAEASVIDEQGITTAVSRATHEVVRTLLPNPRLGRILLDGLLHAPHEYMQETIIRGDASEPSIMLASVVAKVLRDRHMRLLSKQYPLYGFERHKGYGTKAHYDALSLLGPSAIHRLTFLH